MGWCARGGVRGVVCAGWCARGGGAYNAPYFGAWRFLAANPLVHCVHRHDGAGYIIYPNTKANSRIPCGDSFTHDPSAPRHCCKDASCTVTMGRDTSYIPTPRQIVFRHAVILLHTIFPYRIRGGAEKSLRTAGAFRRGWHCHDQSKPFTRDVVRKRTLPGVKHLGLLGA